MFRFITTLPLLLLSINSHGGIITLSETDFNSGSGVITFSEFSLGTNNPYYTPTEYGGEASDPNVSFGGWFSGQSLSQNPSADCPGAAASACIIGQPSSPLSLDANSPSTFITQDGSNPTSPVLSGTPRFNGGIAVLFSEDQFGVGFDGGYFNAVTSTAITAFDRAGNLIGSVSNTVTGIEFLGLATDDGTSSIAGVFLDLVGNEPAGFAIDNIRFGQFSDIDVDIIRTPIPEPSSWALLLIGFAVLSMRYRPKAQKNRSSSLTESLPC
ncbi:PEP-CTERM sorting domain-containing protein [Vibrio alginolyticus]